MSVPDSFRSLLEISAVLTTTSHQVSGQSGLSAVREVDSMMGRVRTRQDRKLGRAVHLDGCVCQIIAVWRSKRI
jgi:hypothetical protein